MLKDFKCRTMPFWSDHDGGVERQCNEEQKVRSDWTGMTKVGVKRAKPQKLRDHERSRHPSLHLGQCS